MINAHIVIACRDVQRRGGSLSGAEREDASAMGSRRHFVVSKRSMRRLMSSRFHESLLRALQGLMRCVPAPQDVLCSVDVGMVAVSAGDAAEARLAFAAPGIDDAKLCGLRVDQNARRAPSL